MDIVMIIGGINGFSILSEVFNFVIIKVNFFIWVRLNLDLMEIFSGLLDSKIFNEEKIDLFIRVINVMIIIG